MREVEIEIPAVDVVLADQLGGVGFVDGALQAFALADELAANIDVARVRAHREAREQCAFDQQVGIIAHDLPVLAGARLALVGIDDEIGRTHVRLRHEAPLEPCREARAAAAAQARRLDLVDDPVVALVDEELGAVPGAATARTLEPRIVEPVDVAEDPVLVLEQHCDLTLGFVGCGRRVCRCALVQLREA